MSLPFDLWLDETLPKVRQPAQYIGGEVNEIRKDPATVRLRVALGYPDTYSVGMGHQGIRILYDLLNRRDGVACERFFCPWPDMEAELRAGGHRLFSLESRTPLVDFDVVGFTLQYELSYTNILTCLDLGGIPLEAKDRDLSHPLVIAGGAGALNPEVLADFVDLFFLGDGEGALVAFSAILPEVKAKAETRAELLHELCLRLPFLYAPSLWEMRYGEDGRLAEAIPAPGLPKPRRAVVYDFERTPIPTAPIVPHIDVVHDRITIEIMRGCVQGCRFCQAGYEKRPQRFRSAAKVLELAEEIYKNTGYDEIGLTSLSSSDHPDLVGIMQAVDERFHARRVNISLPSLRVNEQVRDLPKLVRSVRKSGLTLAPEVATDRLRKIINKNIKNEDLFEGALAAWREGWSQIKLYTMIGIPGEVDEDVAYIAELAEKVSNLRLHFGGRRAGIVHTSVSTFVPKPLTAFQWHGQPTREEVDERQRFLYAQKKNRAVVLKFHERDRSWIEGVLSRADRRIGRLLMRVWELGARMDAWDELFKVELWEQAFRDTGIDPHFYAHRHRPADEVFAWDHLDLGVTKEYLREEFEASLSLGETEHCQTGKCGDCGVGAKTCVEIKGSTGYFPKYTKIVEKMRERGTLTLGIEN